jgi:hypothetical protein
MVDFWPDVPCWPDWLPPDVDWSDPDVDWVELCPDCPELCGVVSWAKAAPPNTAQVSREASKSLRMMAILEMGLRQVPEGRIAVASASLCPDSRMAAE